MSNNDDGSQQKTTRPRRVTFGNVDIIMFPLVLGDNPTCDGVPLTMGWTPTDQATIDLDIYELTHGRNRRPKKQLRISIHDRATHLLSIGCTLDEIIDQEMASERIRRERAISYRRKNFDRFRSAMETALHKLKGSHKLVETTKRPAVAKSA